MKTDWKMIIACVILFVAVIVLATSLTTLFSNAYEAVRNDFAPNTAPATTNPPDEYK